MFIAGPFSGVYNALSLGVNDNGWEMRYTPSGEDIVADNAGDVVQGTIWRGMSMMVGVTLSEWNAPGLYNAAWPWGSDINDISKWGYFKGPGIEMKKDMAKPMIFTSCNYSTARPSVDPTARVNGAPAGGTVTFHLAVLANAQEVRIAFNSRHRKCPLLFRIYAVPTNYSPGGSQNLEPTCPSALKFFDAT